MQSAEDHCLQVLRGADRERERREEEERNREKRERERTSLAFLMQNIKCNKKRYVNELFLDTTETDNSPVCVCSKTLKLRTNANQNLKLHVLRWVLCL